MTGLREVPVRIAVLTDEGALETQIVENLLRSDIHPSRRRKAFVHCWTAKEPAIP